MGQPMEAVTRRIIFLATLCGEGKYENMKNLILILVLISGSAYAQTTPLVGREAAGKYFKPVREAASLGAEDHYMAIHVGKFMESSAWEWGQRDREDKVGNYSVGVTYKMDQFNDMADWNIRVEANEYEVVGEKPFKLSFIPMLIFPDAASKFPIYFGAGAGLGVFFKQLKDESYLAFEYQLIVGARFFDVYENMGFFVESGLRNHLHLLTSGQFNSVFLSIGTVFSF
jgi:hypothetical protein